MNSKMTLELSAQEFELNSKVIKAKIQKIELERERDRKATALAKRKKMSKMASNVFS